MKFQALYFVLEIKKDKKKTLFFTLLDAKEF